MKKHLTIISLLVLMVVTLAGCWGFEKTTSPPTNQPANEEYPSSEEPSGESAEKIYNQTEELEVPEGMISEAHPTLKVVLEATFGGAKFSSFATDYLGLGTGTALVTYTVKREASAKDINTLISNLKNNGYTVESSGKEYEIVDITASKERVQYQISYSEGEQEIEVMMTKIETEEE